MASEVEAVTTLTLNGTPLAELRVTDLKLELEHRGLSKSGSKSQLIERLKAQLLLEKLQQEAAQSSGDEHEGKVPNIALQQDDKAGQNEFVRQYLQQQQRNLEIQMEVKKQFEEERERMSADESSADESRPTKVAADNPELTSATQVKDVTSNAPAKEASNMPRPNRINNRNSVKGVSGSVVDQVKNRPPSPKLDHERQRARSESSQSSRSPSPDQSSKNRRGPPTRTVVRKVERSRSSSSSSSEEEIPKKKQKQGKNSSSRSGSRSPRAVSPKMLAQRSRRQSSADQMVEKVLPHDGSGDKSGRNENTDKTVVTSSRKKWRKKQPQAPAVSESANTNQRKESVAASTLSGTAGDTEERQKSHGGDTNSKDKVVGEYEQDVREVVTGAVLSTATSNVDGEKVELEKGKLTFEEKKKHALQQKGEQDERIVEESSASAKGPQNSSRRQQSRSSSSDSSSTASRSRSPGGKKGTGSGSSSSSSSDSESHTSGSSSESSMEDSPKKATKATGEAQTPGRKPSQTQEKVDKVEEMEVEGTKNKSPVTSNTGRTERDNNALSVPMSASGEPKPKGQEEKQNNLDKEKESRPIEVKEKHGVALGGPDDSGSGVAESLDKTKEHVNKTDADEETAAKKGIKRRKWNSKASKAAKTTKRTSSIEISSDVLKNLIGDVKLTETVFEMETEVVNMLDYDDQEEDQRDVRVKKAQSPNKEEKLEEEDARRVETREESPESAEVPAEPEKKIIKISSAAPKAGGKTKVKEGKKSKDDKKADAGKKEKQPAVVADKEANDNVVATNRIIKPLMAVVDEPEPVTGRQSPPRNPPDRVICIAGLVRPFTVNQLKELLRRSGELDDEYFWINDIKSHCLAAYKTQEHAAAARTALHGMRWPQSNPKILFVDFATIDDVMHKTQEGNVPLPAPVKRPQVEQKKIKEPKNVEKEEKKQKTKEPKEKSRVEREKEERETRDRKREAEKKNFVREWDRDKVQQLSRSRSKSKERDRPVRRSRSRDREQRKRGDYNKEKKEEDRRKEKKQKEAKTDEEPPAKLLDDLFRKTKATPCIYWLPLTEEQTQQKLAKRLEEEKEQQKRIAAAEERQKEEVKKRETARLERHRERDRARDKSRDKDRDRSRPERKASRSSSRSRSRRRR